MNLFFQYLNLLPQNGKGDLEGRRRAVHSLLLCEHALEAEQDPPSQHPPVVFIHAAHSAH